MIKYRFYENRNYEFSQKKYEKLLLMFMAEIEIMKALVKDVCKKPRN